MRNDEKHLMEIPLKQLSRFSQLVHDLRNKPEKIMLCNEEFASVLLNVETNGVDATYAEFCTALANLLSNTIWPE